MARDRIAVLADGHLVGDDHQRVETLVAALLALRETCAAVYVLGDLFEVWLGLREAEPAVIRVREALEQLRAAGVRSVYVEGNRDFRIGHGATAGMFDEVAAIDHVTTFGDVRYHFSHGDLINPADRPYRVWRAVAKNVLAPLAIAVLPSRTARSLADRCERRLRSTNRRHKSTFPRAACVAHAEREVAKGADIVVVGHFHRHEVIAVESGGRHGRLVSLPFWHEEPRPVVFDRAGKLELVER